MSSVGSFFSYVNDARSHEPELHFLRIYNNINKPCGGGEDEDANGDVRNTYFFFVMVPYLLTDCTVYSLTSEKRWWSLFAVYRRIINSYSLFTDNYMY